MADQGFDLRQERLEPLEQSTPARVADPQPKDDRSGTSLPESMGKVLVLGDKNGSVFQGISPDRGIVDIPQADIGDMFGHVAMGDVASAGGNWASTRKCMGYLVTRTG